MLTINREKLPKIVKPYIEYPDFPFEVGRKQ